MSDTSANKSWGRVDDTNTVFVREGDGERAVGQYPDGTAEEALAYFERKYTDLAGQVTLLEQRIKRGTSVNDVAATVTKLRDQIQGANAVGDLAALTARLDVLTGAVQELSEQQKAEQEKARAEARAQREALVDAAEKLAAQDLSKVQWKQTSAELDSLFTQWQAQQKTGPRLPKGEADALWKRFRGARSTIETARRAFFADLDATNREVRQRKERLIEQAEALAPKGADGIPAYRDLLDQWKASGRAGRKLDDQLWARFKTAGDVLYGAKAEVDALADEEYGANLTLKEAVLVEAEPILEITDHAAARSALSAIQRKWDEIGRVPRDSVRAIDARIRKIEDHVRELEETHWKNNNPETKARAEGLRGQLEGSIEQLEADLAKAKAANDARAIAETEKALETQRSWLAAIGS
ncbi:vacuolar-type H+-ATPase subunit H [Lysinibacter cavernae]|uniref:Vacuolar-type H+-ATPase subunit H n=1 Tax=Lysinibacter cavernae TaxID=1640652 RepID=A0A7X5QZL1_9MICO|nr:vacuolar-type H+-ATPase subunit H [Lysinibacter cavernae]